MADPVNFDSPEAILAEWLASLSEFAVTAVAVLGPDPFGSGEDRLVAAVHPASVGGAAAALARSREFGADWRGSDASLAAWLTLARSGSADGGWQLLWRAQGYQSVVRVAFPLPGDRAFECFLFTPREIRGRADAAAMAWSTLAMWPSLARAIAVARSTLSPRERECLRLAFHGLTARESAQQLQCTERTINYHLANAMNKLKVDSKLAAIQRACWLGAL